MTRCQLQVTLHQSLMIVQSAQHDASWRGCRWVAEVRVPEEAAVVDFVMCDGDKRLWDNNYQKDFHTRVRDALSLDQLAQVPLPSVM